MRHVHGRVFRAATTFLERRSRITALHCAQHRRLCSKRPRSFIDKAANFGTDSLLGDFHTSGHGFDQCMRGLKVDRIDSDKGEVFCSVVVGEELENSFKSLHGGAVSTLVDICGTLAILSKDKTKPGVSVELNVSFCSAAKAGSKVAIEGKLLKLGRNLAFTEVVLYDYDTRKVIATGRHTKFV